jgi:hypothetical protein
MDGAYLMGTRRSRHNRGVKPLYKDIDRSSVRIGPLAEPPKRERIVPLVQHNRLAATPAPELEAQVADFLARRRQQEHAETTTAKRNVEHFVASAKTGLPETLAIAVSDRDIAMQLYMGKIIGKTQLWAARMWQHYFEEQTIQPNISIDPSAPLGKQLWQRDGDLTEPQYRAMIVRKLSRAALSTADFLFLDTVLQPDIGRAEAIRLLRMPLDRIVHRLKQLLRGLAIFFGYATDPGGFAAFATAHIALEHYKSAWITQSGTRERMNVQGLIRELNHADRIDHVS